MNIKELLDECDRAYANNDYSRLDWACSSILEEDKTNETALTYRLYIFCDWSNIIWSSDWQIRFKESILKIPTHTMPWQ